MTDERLKWGCPVQPELAELGEEIAVVDSDGKLYQISEGEDISEQCEAVMLRLKQKKAESEI